MKAAVIFSLIMVVGIAHAEYVGICSNERIIYPKNTSEEPISVGDRLVYDFDRKIKNHFLTLDLLDANHNFIKKITYSNSNNYSFITNIKESGFVRFNSGDAVKGHNILVVCPSIKIATPINNPPIWFQTSAQNVFTGGGGLEFVVAATDVDGDKISYSVLNLPDGALFNKESRAFTWIPREEQCGVYEVVFRASDGSNFTDMSVKINVYPYSFKDFPILTKLNFFDISNPLTVNEEELYITTLLVNGSPDLYYRVIEGPMGLVIDSKYGVVYWIPHKGQERRESYKVTIGVSNGKVEVVKSFYIKVKNIK